MPQYMWLCEGCGQEVEVIRPLAQFEVPPTAEEAGGPGVEHEHKWKSILSKPPAVVKGPGWGGGKGRW